MRNFRPSFISGSPNIRISSVKDNAASDMHAHAMLLLKKQQSSNVVEYSPIKTKKKLGLQDLLVQL